MALHLVLQAAQALATLLLPHLSADVIDLGVVLGDRTYVMRMGSVMLALSLVHLVLAVGATVLGTRLAMRCGRDLRARVFSHAQGFSLHEMNRLAVALLMSRTVPYFHKMQGQIDRLNQILREQITGLHVIRALVRDTSE